MTIPSSRGQDDKVWITELNQFPVLVLTRSQGRGMVFLHEGNHPPPSVELKGTCTCPCQPLPGVTHLSTGSSLSDIVPSYNTEASRSLGEIGTKTKELGWPSDTENSLQHTYILGLWEAPLLSVL